MLSPRTVPPNTVLAGALATPAAALAGAGQSAHYLTTLKPPTASPVAIHGGDPKAFVHTGDRLQRGQALMRVRVNTPAHSGLQLRLTCPSGAVTGYGYQGPDALAINGSRARAAPAPATATRVPTRPRSTAPGSSASTPSARRCRRRSTATTTVAS